MTEHYQIAVIGNDPAGLMAAIKLQLVGQKVLVIATEGPAAARQDYQLTDEFCWLNRPQGEELARFVDNLDLPVAPDTDPAWQFVLPGSRLDLYGQPAVNSAELAKQFGTAAAAAVEKADSGWREQYQPLLQGLFNAGKSLYPSGFIDRFTHGFKIKDLQKFQPDPVADVPAEWREVERLALQLWGRGAINGTAAYPIGAQFILSGLLTNPLKLPAAGLRKALLDYFVKVSGHYQEGPVYAINVEKGLPVTVVFGQKQTEVAFDQIIFAAPAAVAAKLLSRKGAVKKLARQDSHLQVAARLWQAHFVIKESGLPEGMAGRGFVYLPDRPTELATPVIYWELHQVAAVPTCKNTPAVPLVDLMITAITAAAGGDLPDADPALLKIIRPTLDKIIPFLDKNLIHSEVSAGTGDVARYIFQKENTIHPAGIPIETPFANGWYCTASCLPGMGLEGCYQCANIVVSRALQFFRR